VRAGTKTAYWWGDDIEENQANCVVCGSQWGGKKTAAVGSFEANQFKLHDTAGNIWKWVQDCRYTIYEGALANGSAWGGGDCCDRVIRGGSWGSKPEILRSADRDGYTPHFRYFHIGFRLAQDL
jgi:formylglycine-generating enzyme required for sulfatase activity